MKRSFVSLAGALLLAASLPLAAAAQEGGGKTFFWVSHGDPADPVWTFFLDGANQWAADTGNTVNTSFHSGDVPTHQEAIRAAITAGADGIVSSSPDPGSLIEVVAEANAAGIPIVNINTPDPDATFDGYVGTVNTEVGRAWAQYLVDGGHVQEGDFVWMPVEVPGATYGVQEEEGIRSVFEPLGITWEVMDASLDQAEIITRMSDYLLANRENIDAMIGLGDLVTGSVARVWDQVGVPAGEIPVVGWGNSPETAQEIIDGYVLAGMWQEPQWTSYTALSLVNAASSGIPLPASSSTDAAPGFDIIVGTLYEADAAQTYLDLLTGASS
jgi:simple sugar transport system substrate-binding protein